MVVGLLEGVPHADVIVIAGFNAVFEEINFKGIDEDALTLECPVTFTRRTPEYRNLLVTSQENK